MLHRKACVLIALMVSFWAIDPLWAEGNIENLRVVWTTDPQHQAVIVWDSKESSDGDFVELSQAGSSEKKLIKAERTTSYGMEGHESISYYFRHVLLTGLKADTTYNLVAHTSEEVSKTYYFKTAPKEGKPFTLIFAGDSRTNLSITETMSDNIAQIAQKEDVLALVHGGDYADKPKLEAWKPWLKAYSRTTGQDGRLLPIIPVCGNHEAWKTSPIFSQAYGYPGGYENFYFRCQLSAEVNLVVLNTEATLEGEQKEFLIQSLKDGQDQKTLWQICAYHRPLYPARKKEALGKDLWVPIFEKYRLNLALEADGHCIKRTVPILNDKPHPEGVVYLGEGGYGAPQGKPNAAWYLQAPGFASQGDHIMLLHFTSGNIQYKAVNPAGKILDQALFKAK